MRHVSITAERDGGSPAGGRGAWGRVASEPMRLTDVEARDLLSF
jgi:hypothetical protein